MFQMNALYYILCVALVVQSQNTTSVPIPVLPSTTQTPITTTEVVPPPTITTTPVRPTTSNVVIPTTTTESNIFTSITSGPTSSSSASDGSQSTGNDSGLSTVAIVVICIMSVAIVGSILVIWLFRRTGLNKKSRRFSSRLEWDSQFNANQRLENASPSSGMQFVREQNASSRF